jgi:Flp pilus assembly protein TadD
LLFWNRGRPQRLFDEAREVFATHPERAEQLLERCVGAAGGAYPAAELLRCRALGATGRWDEATGLFSLIEDKSACEPRELVRLAREAQASHVEALAEMALLAADRPGPEQAGVLRQLISLHLEREPSEQTLEYCRRLARVAPDDPFPWQIEGRLQQQRKEALAAIEAYREALRRKPMPRQELEIRTDLAGLLIDSGDLAQARKEMNRLSENSAAAKAVRMKDAYLLRLEGHSQAALDKVQAVLADVPSSAGALMLRGILRLDQGQLALAAEDLSAVVTAQPFNKEAHYKLGQAYLKLGRPRQAEQHLETSKRLTELNLKILDLEPQMLHDQANRGLASRLAELYEQVGRTEEARRLLDWQPPSDLSGDSSTPSRRTSRGSD